MRYPRIGSSSVKAKRGAILRKSRPHLTPLNPISSPLILLEFLNKRSASESIPKRIPPPKGIKPGPGSLSFPIPIFTEPRQIKRDRIKKKIDNYLASSFIFWKYFTSSSITFLNSSLLKNSMGCLNFFMAS